MNYEMYVIIALSIIIIGLSLVCKKYKGDINSIEYYKNQLLDDIRKLRTANKDLENKIEASQISNQNLQNALLYKPLKDGKRHVYICEVKNSEYDNKMQQIVIIFDEIWTYSLEYFDQKPLCDKDSYINEREIRCEVFIDGEVYDPLLLSHIYKTNKSVEIEDIDCGKYKNRGLGTCIIERLTIILKELGIEKIKAPISCTDFWKKDMLYKFYIEINGFDLVKEVTETEWGLAIKKIS